MKSRIEIPINGGNSLLELVQNNDNSYSYFRHHKSEYSKLYTTTAIARSEYLYHIGIEIHTYQKEFEQAKNKLADLRILQRKILEDNQTLPLDYQNI